MSQKMSNHSVIKNFKWVSKIPRNSGNEKFVARSLYNKAIELSLDAYLDDNNNVIVKKAASKGFEAKETVILQAHLDMVCVRAEKSFHNFDTDPIRIIEKDGLLLAENTSLGADNGIGLSMMLGILEDTSLKHPKLECLFTSDEEYGMTGILGLDKNRLTGKTVINLDGEEEGVITTSCAGGSRLKFIQSLTTTKSSFNRVVKFKVQGLPGGHSGVDIHKNIPSAIKFIGQFINMVSSEIELVSIDGGTADNVIADWASALIKVSENLEDNRIIHEAITKMRFLYDLDENQLVLTEVVEAIPSKDVFTKKSLEYFIKMIEELPQGVIRKSACNNHVVSSMNIGLIKTNQNVIEIICSPRSSCMKELARIQKKLEKAVMSLKAICIVEDSYPGWDGERNSRLYKTWASTYNELTGDQVIEEKVHAGLECGYIAESIENLDMISVGSDIKYAHSIKETADIRSAIRTYEVLLKVLERL